MEIESQHEEAMLQQRVVGLVSPPELAALHQMMRQSEEAHRQKEQELRAELAESRQLNTNSSNLCWHFKSKCIG